MSINTELENRIDTLNIYWLDLLQIVEEEGTGDYPICIKEYCKHCAKKLCYIKRGGESIDWHTHEIMRDKGGPTGFHIDDLDLEQSELDDYDHNLDLEKLCSHCFYDKHRHRE